MKNKTLIVGPKPPPIGGIATIVSLLMKDLENNKQVRFVNSSKKNNKWLTIMLPFIVLFKISIYCIFNHKSNVLIFSSAFRSFWEKLIWVSMINITGSRTHIVMVDGNFPEYFANLSPLKKTLSRFILKKAVVVGQSNNWSQYYKSIFPNSEIKQITGGVDTNYFKPIEVKKKKQGAVDILYVGWIIKEKGIYDLLAAVKNIKDMGINFHLNLVGPIYDDIDNINSAIDKSNCINEVTLCGPIYSRESLRDMYQNSDIFVFPSHYEGFPVALLEALSSGLACIGTNVGGIPDILDNGECGIIIKESKKNLADALVTLINNSELRKIIGAKSRKRAISEYSLSQSVKSYKNLLSIEELK